MEKLQKICHIEQYMFSTILYVILFQHKLNIKVTLDKFMQVQIYKRLGIDIRTLT